MSGDFSIISCNGGLIAIFTLGGFRFIATTKSKPLADVHGVLKNIG
jgi:hypothetical protein